VSREEGERIRMVDFPVLKAGKDWAQTPPIRQIVQIRILDFMEYLLGK
jgi:hypothetical protein